MPRWKRPDEGGDAQAKLIWQFFIIQRLNMERAATEGVTPWPMASQGYTLCQMAGCLQYITDAHRLALVLTEYGTMLMNDEDIGDRATPPWEPVK